MAKQKKLVKKKRKNMFIILEIPDIYKVINKVQVQDKSMLCKIKDVALLPIIENIIKDSSLLFNLVKGNKVIISPGEEKFGQNVPFDQMEAEINEIFNN